MWLGSAPLHGRAERLDEHGEHGDGEAEAEELVLHLEDSLSVPDPPPRRTHGLLIGIWGRAFTATRFGLDTRSVAASPPLWLPAAAAPCVPARASALPRAFQDPPARADHRAVLIGLLFLACVASVPLAGGRLGQLASLTFRAPGLLVAAIAGQVLIVSVFPKVGSEALHTTVHIGTYVVAALFVVANRRIPWVWLVALGGMLNFTAIAANGGVMPAAPNALEKAGFSLDPAGFTNSGAVSHP